MNERTQLGDHVHFCRMGQWTVEPLEMNERTQLGDHVNFCGMDW